MEDGTPLRKVFPGEKSKKGSDFRDCMKQPAQLKVAEWEVQLLVPGLARLL